MGDAAVRMKVMPVSADLDLKALAEEIKKVVPSFARLHAIQEMPIAFGLKALIVVTIMNDKGGRSPDEIEDAVRKVPGVESVEVEEVGLL
ncbi:MAG: elongation factor 1-beta [Methanothrix sp.]|jgi:elongation factor 1-beta|nr:elongation factor 1-beta [Methanothrix sp.]MDD4446746.1 elongation factor 1-beta [Methanothrix sp.]